MVCCQLHDDVRGSIGRGAFLADMGMGFVGLHLGAMLQRDGNGDEFRWSPPTGQPHFPPKAKSVIWLFMNGGLSHVESFDPKPMLTKYGGQTISETPFAYVTDIHATILKQLGLDSHRLEIPGRQRLDIDHGKPIAEIVA